MTSACTIQDGFITAHKPALPFLWDRYKPCLRHSAFATMITELFTLLKNKIQRLMIDPLQPDLYLKLTTLFGHIYAVYTLPINSVAIIDER